MTIETDLPPLNLPEACNYVGVFLTLACNLHCSYCINRFGEQVPARRQLSAAEWARGLNRIVPRPDLPVSLQGGEPTLHPDFFAIINGIRPDLHIDLLTNMELEIGSFMAAIGPDRLKRTAPYASIRVSFHPEVMAIEVLAAKVLILQQSGYSVGIWGVLHPRWEQEIFFARDYCTVRGIDFRTKEFLGEHEGVMYGRLTYPDACDQASRKEVHCRTTELLIGPGGDVYRCHADLYAARQPIGHILDPDLTGTTLFLPCDNYGFCNPCDVKTKTNRFQAGGHTSVEIRFALQVKGA